MAPTTTTTHQTDNHSNDMFEKVEDQQVSLSSLPKNEADGVDDSNLTEEDSRKKVSLYSFFIAFIGCSCYFTTTFFLIGTAAVRTSMGASVGAGENSIWILNIINIFQACVSPGLSHASDLYGRRMILIVCCLLGTIGAAISSRAHSFAMAVVGQSLASCGMTIVGIAYAIPSEVLPRKWRGGAQTGINFFASIAGSLGTIVAGLILRHDPHEGWRIFFYIATGLFFVLSILLAVFYHPPPRRTQESTLPLMQKLAVLDWIGYLLLTIGLCLFLVGTTNGGIFGWHSGKALGPLVTGILVSIGFGLYEWKGTEHGMCKHVLFQNRNYPLAALAIFVEGAILFSILGFFGVASSVLWAKDAFWASFYTFPFYTVSLIFFPLLGLYVNRFKEVKKPLVLGYTLYMLACIGLATSKPGSGKVAWFYVALAGTGFCAPLSLLVTVAQLAVPPKYIGTASAFLVSARAIGAAVGIAVYAAILSSKLSSHLATFVTEGAFKGGLLPQQAATVLPKLIPAVASGNPALIGGLMAVPGVTPAIIGGAVAGLKEAFAYSLKYVWIAAVVFAFTGIISVLVLKEVRPAMTHLVDAPAVKTGSDEMIKETL